MINGCSLWPATPFPLAGASAITGPRARCPLRVNLRHVAACRAVVESQSVVTFALSARTVWKRRYGAQVKRIRASTGEWIWDLVTGQKILESRLLPGLSPATKYIPAGITTFFNSVHSRQGIVGSGSLSFCPPAVVTKILHAP